MSTLITIIVTFFAGMGAGLGGDTGWTKNIHPEYRVCKGRYSYTFRFHFA